MKRLLILTLALALPAMAQDNDRRDRGDRSDRARRGQRRDGGGDRRGGDRRGGVERMVQRMVEQLNLDDEQRAQFDEILAAQRERMQEQGQIRREIREAEQDGDKERAAELRAELGDQGRRRGNPMAGLLDELEPILHDDQMEAFRGLRDRMGAQRGGQRGDRGRGLENLIKELDLTEDQQKQWEEIRSEQREQGRNRWEQIRPLMEEMREARESGDEDRLAEIRAKFEEMRGGNRGGNDAQLAALAEILTEQQASILERFRERANRRGGRDNDRGRGPDVRTIIQAAKRLELDDDQKQELRDIEQTAGRRQRQVRRDREAAAKLAEKVKAEIGEILNADQKRTFERRLERGNRRGDRSGQGRRGRDRDRSSRRPANSERP